MLEMLLSKRQEITSDDGATEKREPLHTVGRNVNWCSHYGKQYGDFSKKLKVPWGGEKKYHRTHSYTSELLSKGNKTTNLKR